MAVSSKSNLKPAMSGWQKASIMTAEMMMNDKRLFHFVN